MMYALQQNIVRGLSGVSAGLKNRFNHALLKYDSWFPVSLALLFALSFTIVAAMGIWCTVYKRLTFTGNWYWNVKGISVSVQCQ